VREGDEAIDGLIEMDGKDSPSTNIARIIGIAMQIQLGHLDDAERRIAVMDQSLRSMPAHKLSERTTLENAMAEVARLRGDLSRAETITRAALASLAEVHARPDETEPLVIELAEILVDAHRYAEASPVVERARSIAKSYDPAADVFAELDMVSAELEDAAGHRDAAIALAEHVRDVLADYPASIITKKRVAADLARMKRARKR
jgi:hypothetical protein